MTIKSSHAGGGLIKSVGDKEPDTNDLDSHVNMADRDRRSGEDSVEKTEAAGQVLRETHKDGAQLSKDSYCENTLHDCSQ